MQLVVVTVNPVGKNVNGFFSRGFTLPLAVDNPTEPLIRKVIERAVEFYDARAKGVAAKLQQWGYLGRDGDAFSSQAISVWKTEGTGLQAGPFLALARDMKLDMNALLYRGEVTTYDPKPDLLKQRRQLEQMMELAQRTLDLLPPE